MGNKCISRTQAFNAERPYSREKKVDGDNGIEHRNQPQVSNSMNYSGDDDGVDLADVSFIFYFLSLL